jgi:glycogen debranching enzyme
LFKDFKKFSDKYDEDIKEDDVIDWGFGLSHDQISFKEAEDVNSDREKIINNRSFITSIKYANKKIIFPGDIEEKGWDKAFEKTNIKNILKGTDFFVASHHGRRSGRNNEMLDYTGQPDIFIVSAKPNDDTDYDFYSDKNKSKGFKLEDDSSPSHVVSTKRRDKSFKFEIKENGDTKIKTFKASDNLNKNQQALREKRTARAMKQIGLK